MFRVQYATHMRSNMQNGSPRWKICSSGQCLKRTLSFVSRHCSACKEAIILQRYHKVAYVKTIPLTDSYLPLRQFRPQNYLRKTIRLTESLKVISLLELPTLRQLRYHRLTDVKTIPLTDSYLTLRQFRPQNYLRKTIRLPELLKVISLLELLTLRQLRYHRLTYLKIIPLPQIYLR